MKYVQNYCEFYIVLLNILYKQLKFKLISKYIRLEKGSRERHMHGVFAVCAVSIIMPYKCIAVAATPATF